MVFALIATNIFSFCASFAELPQMMRIFVCCLREFRKQHTVLCYICGSSASIMQFCNIFAGELQATCSFVLYLRKFRKQNAVLCNICGSSASNIQFWDMFAVELQATCNLETCLQLNCKCGAKKEAIKIGAGASCGVCVGCLARHCGLVARQ